MNKFLEICKCGHGKVCHNGEFAECQADKYRGEKTCSCPNYEINLDNIVNRNIKKRNQVEEMKPDLDKHYKYFFDYFLSYHAIICTKKDCVCRASTFQDLICEPELRNSKEYGKDIEEILRK